MGTLESTAAWPEIVRRRDEATLAALAERAGVTPGEVAAALERSGVLVHGPDDALPPEPGEDGASVVQAELLRPGSKDGRIAALSDLLGKVPDKEIAAKAGVSIRTVASFRARHDIPGYRGPRRARTTTRASRPAAAPAPRPRPRAGAEVAWQVTWRRGGEESTAVLVAGSLSEAAAAAEAAGRGEVVLLRMGGPILRG